MVISEQNFGDVPDISAAGDILPAEQEADVLLVDEGYLQAGDAEPAPEPLDDASDRVENVVDPAADTRQLSPDIGRQAIRLAEEDKEDRPEHVEPVVDKETSLEPGVAHQDADLPEVRDDDQLEEDKEREVEKLSVADKVTASEARLAQSAYREAATLQALLDGETITDPDERQAVDKVISRMTSTGNAHLAMLPLEAVDSARADILNMSDADVQSDDKPVTSVRPFVSEREQRLQMTDDQLEEEAENSHKLQVQAGEIGDRITGAATDKLPDKFGLVSKTKKVPWVTTDGNVPGAAYYHTAEFRRSRGDSPPTLVSATCAYIPDVEAASRTPKDANYGANTINHPLTVSALFNHGELSSLDLLWPRGSLMYSGDLQHGSQFGPTWDRINEGRDGEDETLLSKIVRGLEQKPSGNKSRPAVGNATACEGYIRLDFTKTPTLTFGIQRPGSSSDALIPAFQLLSPRMTFSQSGPLAYLYNAIQNRFVGPEGKKSLSTDSVMELANHLGLFFPVMNS